MSSQLKQDSESGPAPPARTVQDRLAQTRSILAEMQVRQPRGIKRPPGPRGPGIWLAMASGRQSPFKFVEEMAEYGPISYTNPFGAHAYLLSDPTAIWQVFVEQAQHLHKGRGIQTTRAFLGNGLLNSEGAEHRYNRRQVQPAFSRSRLAGYAQQMIAAADRTSLRWQSRVASGDTEIQVVDEMSALTLDVVGRTLLGMDLSQDTTRVSAALDQVLESFNRLATPSGMFLTRFPSPMRRRLIAAVESLDEIVMPLIECKRKELEQGGEPTDALAMLLQARDPETGDRLSDQQVRDETVTLVLAGHETTAMLLAWTWLELARNPDVLRWVIEEWEQAKGREALTLAGVSELNRTNAVVAESLRMHPPAWALGRTTMAEVSANEYLIPRGSMLVTSQYVMHRHPDYWSEPLRFRPQRWLDSAGTFDERNPGQPRGSWFPFAFGARKCIGDRFALAEAALLLASLGQRWHIVPTAPSLVTLDPAVTLRPSNGIPARIRPRVREV